MGWSGGTYTKGNAGSGGWTGDASLGIGIEAGRHDTQDNDFATGINTCLTKDGQNTPTANLPMGGYKHTGVGNASAADEYLSYGQLLDVSKAVTTSGTAPNYTVTLTPAPSAYATGQIFAIRIHSALLTSAGATLNVNGLGAKALKIATYNNNLRDPVAVELGQRVVYYVSYDGTDDCFRIVNPTRFNYNSFTPTIGSSAGTATLGSTDCTYSLIDDLVIVSYDINFALSGATAQHIILSLPFARRASYQYLPLVSCYVSSVAGYTEYNAITSSISSDSFYFYRGDQNDFPIDANMYFRANGLYKASF